MPYLIDGHNLIPKIPGLSLAALDDEEQLIRLLQPFARSHTGVEVYFDGAPAGQSGKQHFGSLTAHFVHYTDIADNAIKRRLHRLGKAARNWTVVSSDREVQQAARQAGAAVISSQQFARQLNDNQLKTDCDDEEKPIPDDNIEDWLKLFGEEEG